MPNEAKREAQEALFTAIRDQAELSGKAALPATEKIHLLRELAEAYRLTAGGSMPSGTSREAKPAEAQASARSSDDGVPRRTRSR